MTRPEMSGRRSLGFSKWIRKELPNSKTGFCVTNLDWIFYNYKTKRIMLAEEKTHGAKPAKWFMIMMQNVVDPAFHVFARANGYEYRGFHLIVFENETPQDGRIFWDGSEITETELRDRLSMKQ